MGARALTDDNYVFLIILFKKNKTASRPDGNCACKGSGMLESIIYCRFIRVRGEK